MVRIPYQGSYSPIACSVRSGWDQAEKVPLLVSWSPCISALRKWWSEAGESVSVRGMAGRFGLASPG